MVEIDRADADHRTKRDAARKDERHAMNDTDLDEELRLAVLRRDWVHMHARAGALTARVAREEPYR